MSAKRRVQRTASWVMAVLLCAGFGAACGAATPTPVTDGRVDVGGYELYIRCEGEGTPAVIFETGYGGPGLGWYKIRDGIMDVTRACYYDRVGLGQSDPCPKDVYTTRDTVEDLHNLLKNANIPGPYVLVAHSSGGLAARLYAGNYAEDVAGMVWIEASPPDMWDRYLAVLPPESEDDPDTLKEFREFYAGGYREELGSGPEFLDWDASADQVSAVGSLGSIPLVVLTADHAEWPASLPPEVGESLFQEWLRMQDDQATLSANSQHVIVEDSTHLLPDEHPDTVIQVIRDLVLQIRGE